MSKIGLLVPEISLFEVLKIRLISMQFARYPRSPTSKRAILMGIGALDSFFKNSVRIFNLGTQFRQKSWSNTTWIYAISRLKSKFQSVELFFLTRGKNVRRARMSLSGPRDRKWTFLPRVKKKNVVRNCKNVMTLQAFTKTGHRNAKYRRRFQWKWGA